MTKNVLLIICDALRADRLGCYGCREGLTPNIDAAARSGVVFSNAIAQAPFTTSSVASILTGLYPSIHGMQLGTDALDSSLEILPHMLRQRGFYTAAFIANPYVSREAGYARGCDHFYDGRKSRSLPLRTVHALLARLGAAASAWDRSAECMNSLVLDHLRGMKRGRPFFCTVFYVDAHAPYRPPERFARQVGVSSHGRDDQTPDFQRRTYTAEQVERIKRLYDASIAYLDQQIGNLIDSLATNGILDDTLVVLTADHGEGFSWRRAAHGRLYEDGIRVPLIFFDTQMSTPKVVHGLAQSIDIVPTILQMIDIPLPRQISRLPALLQGRPRAGHLAARQDTLPDQEHVVSEDHHSRAVRTSRWKYIRKGRGIDVRGEVPATNMEKCGPPEELYDLATDPAEKRNLAETRTQVLERMRLVLSDYERQLSEYAVDPESFQMDSEVRARLRALGYLE